MCLILAYIADSEYGSYFCCSLSLVKFSVCMLSFSCLARWLSSECKYLSPYELSSALLPLKEHTLPPRLKLRQWYHCHHAVLICWRFALASKSQTRAAPPALALIKPQLTNVTFAVWLNLCSIISVSQFHMWTPSQEPVQMNYRFVLLQHSDDTLSSLRSTRIISPSATHHMRRPKSWVPLHRNDPS